MEEGDHRAGGFVDDPADQLERVDRAFAERDEGDIGVFLARGGADLVDLDTGGDDDVAEAGEDLGDDPEAFLFFVGDQDA